MQSVLEHLTDSDEVGFVKCGQSNALPYGDRDSEGYVASPHLKLSAAGLDLTIQAIAPASTAAQGAVGTRSIVTVAEDLQARYWINGELRLVAHDYGEAPAICMRRGHAKVIDNAAGAVLAGVLFDTATERVLWAAHGRPNGSQVTFETTGSLPGLTVGQVYYVINAAPNTFQVSLDPNGSAVALSGGSGTHTARARPCLTVEWLSEFQAPTAGVTFTAPPTGSWVNHTAHNLPNGSTVSFTGTLPPELTAGVKYYMVAVDADSYALAASRGGSIIIFTGAGGSATVTPDLMVDVAGYVHLHDRFKTYPNVQVVTPFQPIEPGDYPAGTPVVPGFTLPSDVTTYADAALALPFAWNEGIDGHGAVGTGTVSGLVVTLTGGLTVEDKLFAGGFIRVGNAKGKVASNTTSTVTVESWTPTAGPGAGTLPVHLHLPHWRSNPHHFTAGEGFLYPSNEMQPGGHIAESTGLIYSRPRARLAGSYVGRIIATGSVGASTIAAGIARLTTAASADLTVSADGTYVTVTRANTSRNPANGLVQFEDFARPGQIVLLAGLGQSPGVDGFWRLVTLNTSAGVTGSSIVLEPYDPGTVVPGSVSGTVPAGASVTRYLWTPTYRFGSLIETAWRMATELGRRIVVTHLGINGSSQIAAATNNPVAPQGKIGWWDDDIGFDWTPSNPTGLAARLKRLVQFIAPRAVRASFGDTRTLKFVAGDVWQGETDATFAAGRDLAPQWVSTFVNWLRAVITGAGLSPYVGLAKIPFHWAQITQFPWEIAGLGGDVNGQVNAAILRWVARDAGFGCSYDPEGQPKVIDGLHYNGTGEANNGKQVAALLVPLIRFAFSFSWGPGAVAVANEALSMIGDATDVTSLQPPNASTQARLCAQMFGEAIDAVLQSHAWTFATRRVQPPLLAETVSTWAYGYGLPADVLHPTTVLAADATDDLQLRTTTLAVDPTTGYPNGLGTPATQPFTIEVEPDGLRVLRTDQESPVLVYTARNIDVRLWDPAARQALVHYLAHKLAGATLKGRTGTQVSQAMLQAAMALIREAAALNAQYQRDVRVTPTCPWLPQR